MLKRLLVSSSRLGGGFLRIALIQMNSDERKERNLSQAERLITEAAGSSPMCCSAGVFLFLASEKETLHTAESIPGSTTDMLSLLSRKFDSSF